MRPLAALYAIAASILVVGLVLQVFLAGPRRVRRPDVLPDPPRHRVHAGARGAGRHRARRGRPRRPRPDRDRGTDLRAVPAPVGVRRPATTAPTVAALHPVNGFLILLLSIVLARRAWAFARASRAAAEAPAPASTPAAGSEA